MKRQGRGRNPESGYALLFILSMAAIMAIMLYRELPRVAFEAQRDKEQLLIDRGEQYTRAVNLFVRKFNRYPADFDALQNTQNLRFLRHKYIDPMTGKDDWRIVHVGPGGVFIDSLVYGKKKDDKKPAEQQTFIAEMQQTGGNQVDANQNVNLGLRQRQSDQAGGPGDPNNAMQTIQPDLNGQPNPNGPVPGQVLPNGQFAPPGQQANQPVIPAFPGGVPGQQFPGGFPGQPGGVPGQQLNQPGVGPPSAAANLIGQILTTPRPGGLNGLGGVQQGTVDPNAPGATNTTGTAIASLAAPVAAGAPTIGGGMAGVASKREEDGIKSYKDQKSYHKWEFVYDITKDPLRVGNMVPQAAAPPPGTPIGTPAPTGAITTPTPNGTTITTPTPNMTPPPTPAPVTSP
jgi:hypothetical protein